MDGKNRHFIVSYGLAIVSTLLATWLRFLFQPALGEHVPFITYFPAVMVAAWFGGLGPALLAVVLSTLAAFHYIVPPDDSLLPDHVSGWMALTLFVGFGIAIAGMSEWMRRRAVQVRRERKWFSVTLSSIGDAVITTDLAGRVTYLNAVAEELTGWSEAEAEGQPLETVFRIVDEQKRIPIDNPVEKALGQGRVVGLANHTILIAKDGTERPIDDSAAPIREADQSVSGVVLIFRDITARRGAERAEAEHKRLMALRLEVSTALATNETLQLALQQCTQALVDHLDMAFARIWTLDHESDTLELQASAGLYTHLDGSHGRIKLGDYKIGRIAENRQPHLTNDVLNDPNISDPEWARREGMVAFAGYPLKSGTRVYGVLAMFARHPLSDTVLNDLRPLADNISQFIEWERADEQLEEQREWLSVTLASIGDAVIATDTQERVTFLNGVAQSLTGWSQEEAEGTPLKNIFVISNEMTGQPVENPVDRVLREGAVVGLANHTVLTAKDGSERPIDDSAAPIRDASGAIIGVVLIFRDVTEQKKAEREIREREQRYRLIGDAANDAIWDWDQLTNQVIWNEGMQTQFGYTPKQIGAQADWWVEHIHAEDRDRVVDGIHSVIDGSEENWTDEYRFLRADGSYAYVLDRGKVMRNESGKSVRMIGSMLDLTERRLNEERLREQEEQYRSIFESTSDAILIFNYEGQLLEANSAACAMHGYTYAEFVGIQGTQIIHPDDHYKFADFVRQIMAGKEYHVEGVHIRNDGTPLSIKVTGTSFQFAGQPALLAVVRDVTEEKKATEALRESEEFTRQIVDSSHDCIKVLDMEGRLLSMSAGGQTRMEIEDIDEFLNKSWVDFWEGDDRVAAQEAVHTASAGGVGRFEGYLPTQTGTPKWWDVLVTPIGDGDGKPERLLTISRDITERIQAEEREGHLLAEAATASAKFQAFFDQGPLFAGIVALDGTLLEANQLSLEACGFSREDAIGRLFWECPWWSPSPALQEQIQAAAEQAAAGEPFQAELPYFIADGSRRTVDFNMLPIKDQDGRVLFIAPTGSDVTERKQAEAALQDNERRFRALVEQVQDYAIFTIDIEGHPTSWNEGVKRTLGFDEAEFVGQDITNLIFTPADQQNNVPEAELAEARETGTASNDRWMQRKDGTQFFALGVTTCLLDGNGDPLGFMKVMRDQTDRKQMEDELRRVAADLSEADRRKDEFLAMLAHELRNPLAPIRSGLDILAMEQTNGESRIITLMQEQLEHVVRLVDDLLDVSRIMRGMVELRQEPVELAVLVNRSVEAVRTVIDTHGHELEVSLPEKPVWLNADPVRIVQILENLLMNASKYMDGGGRIELTAACDNGEAVISVDDTGVGIEAELLPKIFELFTQSSRSLDRSQGGLGIGLTLVKRLVEMHDGTVSVHSDGDGHGSTFVVRLPVAAAPQTAVTEIEQTPATQSGRRIVVVDDNASAAWLLSSLLEKLGNHEVTTASDGPSALERIKEIHPEIVLLDIGLPGMDGYQVGRAVREDSNFDDVLLIALTGYGQEEDRRKSKEAGFDEHLVKPPSIDQMKQVLSHPKLLDSKT